LTTSTLDLISSIPPYMIGIISTRILGFDADPRALAEGLSDEDRLRKILDELPERQKNILMDLHELGGYVLWDILAKVYGKDTDELRVDLEQLGHAGLVFQGGLSGRDPVILLPSLTSILESVKGLFLLPVEELAWKDPRKESLWGHITMLNSIRVEKIRCKAGLEPFKKGWEYLEEKLGTVMDVKRIYWELVELGCLKEKNGTLGPQQKAAANLAMEGDARYRLWRYIQWCKPYPGLDYQIYITLGEKAVRRDFLSRSLHLWTANKDETIEDVSIFVGTTINILIELGILREDETCDWIRFSDDVFTALKTGRTDPAVHTFSEEVIIQPTMEILVPFDFDSVDLLNVGEIADLVQADMVSIYLLTRESVFRALQEGWDAEKILHFLDRISRHTLPNNVRMNIVGWARSHPEAHLIKGTFLVLSGDKSLTPKGLDEVLPGIYRIPERCEEEVSSFLEKRGVMVRSIDGFREGDGDIDWGKSLPLKAPVRNLPRVPQKEGVYPFGMVIPLPYGPRRESIFEEVLKEGRDMVVLYPRQGYGEVQARKISPVYIFRRGGIAFMEAFCEDTGEGEVFDISKVRGIFKQQ